MVSTIGVFLLLLFLAFIYNSLFWTIPRSSDNAALILEASSFLHGNLLLRGWSLAPDTFWTIDIPINALLMAIRGFTPSLMYNAPALIYALVVVVSLALVKNTGTLKDKLPNLIVSLLIIGIPSPMLTYLASHNPSHIGTILYFLVALFAMERIKPNRLRCLVVFAILTLAYIGDPFALYIFLAPLLIFLCVRWYHGTRKLDDLFLIASTIAVIPATQLVLLAVKLLGGFYSYPANTTFATFTDLSKNISLTVQGVLSLFGVDFFGQSIASRGAIESLVRIPLLVLVAYFSYRTVKGFINRSVKYDAISEILSLSIVFDVLSYIFSDNTINIMTARYLFPVVVFGAIIVGRQLVIRDTSRANYLILIGLFGVTCLFFLAPRITAPIGSSPTAQVESWLLSHGYKYGYGAYWEASIITVETSDVVRVRPVVTDGSGKIVPFNWLSDQSWYSEPANFLVYDTSGYGGVNMSSAVRTFGSPSQVVKIGDYTILTWKNPYSAPGS